MEERQLNAFANARLDHSIKLAIARDLQRLYSAVVAEPIPSQLRVFVERLGQALEPGVEEVEIHGTAISDWNLHAHPGHSCRSALRGPA